MVTSRFTLVCPILRSFRSVVMFVAISLRPKSQVHWPIVSKLVADAPHVLNVIWTCICPRSNLFVVFDAEVDA